MTRDPFPISFSCPYFPFFRVIDDIRVAATASIEQEEEEESRSVEREVEEEAPIWPACLVDTRLLHRLQVFSDTRNTTVGIERG